MVGEMVLVSLSVGYERKWNLEVKCLIYKGNPTGFCQALSRLSHQWLGRSGDNEVPKFALVANYLMQQT